MTQAWPPTVWRVLVLAPALVVAPLASGTAPAQAPADSVTRRGAILVQVTDTSINPLAAEIVLPALRLGVRLSDEGTLSLVSVPEGVYLVQARHLAHDAAWALVRVTQDTISVHFVLAPASAPTSRRRVARLDASVAGARLASFLARSSSIASGSFLTREEIRRRRARSMTTLLGGVRDVSVERSADGSPVIRSRDAPAEGCASGMLVFVDAERLGSRPEVFASEPRRRGWSVSGGAKELGQTALRWVGAASRGHVSVSASSVMPAPIAETEHARPEVDRIPISSVAAVEVYPTATSVPPEFRLAGAECGVVLIWR